MNVNKPIIILVRPQLAENIGATARVMANFGLDKLRLISPKSYDRQVAGKVACHGRDILDNAVVFDDLKEALSDCVYSIATSRRIRRVKIEPITPKSTAEKLVTFSRNQLCGLVFGAERTGLTNEEIYLCDTASSIPTAEAGSLNLAQAVLLYLYEWHQVYQPTMSQDQPWQRLANHQEKQLTYSLLEDLMKKSNYKPFTRLPEFIRRFKHVFENRPLNYRENRILLKVFRYLEKLTEK